MQVVYMSGYTDNVVLDRGLAYAGEFFVRKPLTPDVLAKEVRRALDAGPAPSEHAAVASPISP
jgi:hypothetical protein